MSKFVNKTPHEVVVVVPGVNPEGDEWVQSVSYAPEGPAARVSVSHCECDTVSVFEGGFAVEVPVFQEQFGQVENLPDPVEDTFYVVSRVVAEAVRGKRNDVVYPTKFVRDDDGKVVGCEGFVFA